MSRQRIAIAASLLVVSSIMTWSLTPVNSQSLKSKAMLISGHARYSRVTPPQGGVKLLQDIFNRVRSTPQIAMAKTGAKKLAESQQLMNQGGPTDYKLAIRPTNQGKNVQTQGPQLAWMPSTSEKNSMPAAWGGLQGATNGTIGPGGASLDAAAGNGYSAGAPAGGGGGGALPPTNMGKWVHVPGDNMYSAQAQVQSRRSTAGKKQQAQPQLIAQAPPPPAMPGNFDENSFLSNNSGSQKTRGIGIAPRRAAQPTPAVQPQPLAVTMGRLGGVYNDMNRKMEEADKLSSAADAPAPAAKSPITKASSGLRQVKVTDERGARFKYAPNIWKPEVARIPQSASSAAQQQQQSSNSTTVAGNMRTYVKESKGTWNSKDSLGIWEPPAAEPAAEAESGDAFGFAGGSNSHVIANNKAADRELIALLPPNVVTGIPLIRLGISETQASSALAQIGKMKLQQVNNWNVWTWVKPGDQDPAMQLYVRHGLLDAMRIFDKSLIGTDFGVTLGDDLSKVKEKFGEPAFILSEPQPGAGQNYIYPISQVGFQIARPAPDQPPRVVSVLIFHVK